MDLSAMLQVARLVLRDWRVIFIALAVILYLSIFTGITSYRKKPRKAVKKAKAPREPKKPKPKKGEGEGEEGEEEETEEGPPERH
jgi:hypothetical protein